MWSPLVDDFGKDFAVTDATRAAALRVQPKGTVGLDGGRYIALRVREATFTPRRFDFMVFANFDPAAVALSRRCFVVRADEFAAHAKVNKGYRYFQGAPDPAAKGKWRPWLYEVSEVARVFETALEQRRRGHGRLCARREEVEEVRREMGMRAMGAAVGDGLEP
jgi:hypothetical protein